MARFLAPRPPHRPEGVSVLGRWRRARRDLFSALKPGLYRAWMAEVRTPFRDAYLVNQPELVRLALVGRPRDFPKAGAIATALADLLGESVFVTNGPAWERQRRIIDPAFEGGRLQAIFPSMLGAAEAAAERIAMRASAGPVEIEAEASRLAADIIFRALFSAPIGAAEAEAVFDAFRRYQEAGPVVSLLDVIGAPRWAPRLRRGRREARAIRALVGALVARRAEEIAAGAAPDDLATRIMTTPDPETGEVFSPAEMLDQVMIFFLAGHETSASALAWALWLLANDAGAQTRAQAEIDAAGPPSFSILRRLPFTRDVFREALRLYPPVPMLVRETARPEHFRKRDLRRGSFFILSPWHLHRHERIWPEPDRFDPDRWSRPEEAAPRREAYIPFSAGPRVCPGAGFAMMEGVLSLAILLARFSFAPAEEPRPVARLTLRSANGIRLLVTPR